MSRQSIKCPLLIHKRLWPNTMESQGHRITTGTPGIIDANQNSNRHSITPCTPVPHAPRTVLSWTQGNESTWRQTHSKDGYRWRLGSPSPLRRNHLSKNKEHSSWQDLGTPMRKIGSQSHDTLTVGQLTSWQMECQMHSPGTSLVAQWLRICLPMQGTRVPALVQEDLTCHRATKPTCHNYWSPCSATREATAMRSLPTHRNEE